MYLTRSIKTFLLVDLSLDYRIIKIWSPKKTPLTEIILQNSLSTVHFLNDHADIVCGYQNHLFLIKGYKGIPVMYYLYM